MTRRRKQQIRDMLTSRNLSAIRQLAKDDNSALRLFFSETYRPDELHQWRAIEAMGHTADVQASRRMDRIRDFVRRLFWLMNDESGGLGWRAPEAIGEILVHIPQLADELAVLLPQYFVEEPFERGAFFAVYRIANNKPELYHNQIETLKEAVKHDDAGIRTYALLALEAMGEADTGPEIQSLTQDDSEVPFYDFTDGKLTHITTASVAKRVIG